MSNRNLHRAQANRDDEFYTRLEDIEKELRYYKDHFKDKVVFCNCDDPFESNFVKYFALNFNYLGLKKLIATCYVDSPVAWGQLSLFDINTFDEKPINDRTPYRIEISEVKDFNEDGATDILDIEYLLKNKKNTLTVLKGDGDFRSKESLELLKEADIVVTNPPFSLFREYVAQLMDYDKKFIILGNPNAIGYKEIFPLITTEKIWWGVKSSGGQNMYFIASPEKTAEVVSSKPQGSWWKEIDGVAHIGIKTVWYTNLEHSKRNEKMILYKTYNPTDYPKYDNYDAIEVSKVKEIPLDYDGIMGVPVTFLDKFNPNQFEIVGMCENLDLYGLKTRVYTAEECRNRYFELFGKKGVYDLNASGVINGKKVYLRLLIKKRK